jgi:hypothetical protein
MQRSPKRASRDLLAALLGQSSLEDWHEEVERVAPDLRTAVQESTTVAA